MADHRLQEELLALIEIPKGSRNKYEYDEGIDRIILDRFLSSSTVYPTDYGYLIDHRGRDGDPLDVLVCVSEPTFPGCVIPVKPIALLTCATRRARTTRSSACRCTIRRGTRSRIWTTSPEQFQLEVAHFFSVYKQLDNKPVEIKGWHGRERALEVIADAKALHRKEQGEG